MKYQAPFGSSDPDAPYVDRNTPGATSGSRVPAAAIEDDQRELAALIAKSGLTPSDADLLQVAKAVRSQALNYRTPGGAADALTLTLDPVPAAYTELTGAPLRIIVSTPNATTTPTLNVNGLGAKTIVRHDGTALVVGDLKGLIELVYDGTNFRINGLVANSAGRLINIQIITATGTYTPTVGMTFCIVEGVGAGGGGAGTLTPGTVNYVSLGSPGSAGAWGRARFTAADIGASKAVTIGAGGAGGVSANGGNGGATSIAGLLTIPGGIGGSMSNNIAPPTFNDAGAIATAPTGANMGNSRGVAPGYSLALSAFGAFGGSGGSGPYGTGGGVSANTTGTPGVGYGSGGSGTAQLYGTTALAAGAGAPGLLIILEYGA